MTGISGFGLGCQLRRVGILGCKVGLGVLEFGSFWGVLGSMFLGYVILEFGISEAFLFVGVCRVNLIPTGRSALDRKVLGGASQWKSYGRPTYVGALTLGYCIGSQPLR